MVDGIGNIPLTGTQHQSLSEYEDVLQALQKAFPEKAELEIQQALTGYLGALEGKNPSEVDSQLMLDHIMKTFNVELSTKAAMEIKKEWEELTKSLDLGVSDLASILSSYSSNGIDKTDRAYLTLLWQMLQGELEEALGEEGKVVAEKNKEMQQTEFQEFIDKKIEEMEKAGKTKFWNKALKWLGVLAAVVGAVVACVVAAAAIATGVGAPAGALLIAAAAIMITLAITGAVTAVGEEFGQDWDVFSQAGKGIAKLLNAMGADINVEEFAKWFSLGVQLALTVVAIVCSFGASAVATAGSAAATGANAVKTGVETANTVNKVAQNLSKAASYLRLFSAAMGGLTAGTQIIASANNYALAEMQAQLLELMALLEQLAETRNMDQDLMASILSKIFEAMRGHVADSTDTLLQDMQMIAGMNLNKA